jgi:hypothetical protein
VDIERRIDSDMAVRRLVDSWLSRSVAGLPSSSDDDPGPRWVTGRDDGHGPRRRSGPDDDPGPDAGLEPESGAALDEFHGTEPAAVSAAGPGVASYGDPGQGARVVLAEIIGAGPGDHAAFAPGVVVNGAPWPMPGLAPDEDSRPDLGTGLDVPHAPAEVVIATARRVATSGRWTGPRPDPAPELRSVAEAMVLDEHPSASGWTLAERRDALDWIALIIARFGEDGVQRLVAELNEHH